MCNLHWCYTLTALLSTNQKSRNFFMCIISTEMRLTELYN